VLDLRTKKSAEDQSRTDDTRIFSPTRGVPRWRLTNNSGDKVPMPNWRFVRDVARCGTPLSREILDRY